MKNVSWKRIGITLPVIIVISAVSLFGFLRLSDGSEAAALKWGFIDRTGKEVIALKYGWVGSFSEGLAAVGTGGRKELVTEELIAGVKTGGKWGFIDKTGKEVIDLKYEGVGSFSGGLAAVAVRK